MSRKDVIVILVLVALVAIAATARLSGMTPAVFGRQNSRRGGARGGRPLTPEKLPRAGLGRLIWPAQRQRYQPRGLEARTLFDAGERIFVEGLFDAAAATYQRFLDTYPQQAACEVARLRMGQCFTLAERHTEAAGQYELFLKRHPDSDLRPLALLWSGVHHAHLGKRDVARARFQQVLDDHPTSPCAEGARQRLAALGRQP